MRAFTVVATVGLLLLAGCSGAETPADPEPSGPSKPASTAEPTDSLSDSTAYFTVNVSGRARVSWSDGMGPAHVEDVGPGTHRYGSINWQADQLSVITAVPLDQNSTATCAIETGTENRKKSRLADEASSPQNVALCYVSRVPYRSSPSRPGKAKLVQATATSATGGAVSLTWAGNNLYEDEDFADPASIEKRTDGHVATMVISRRAEDAVSCDLMVAGRIADTHKASVAWAPSPCARQPSMAGTDKGTALSQATL